MKMMPSTVVAETPFPKSKFALLIALLGQIMTPPFCGGGSSVVTLQKTDMGPSIWSVMQFCTRASWRCGWRLTEDKQTANIQCALFVGAKSTPSKGASTRCESGIWMGRISVHLITLSFLSIPCICPSWGRVVSRHYGITQEMGSVQWIFIRATGAWFLRLASGHQVKTYKFPNI